ncbi:MAG: beta-ketoacyl-[acyl-carrier-protein] synthase family protein [Clostridiales bacterium]|nr:beta-ketoacyl-[acyl-carrier-protein] synthase family protein [Clostridiales bacterium]
MINDEKRCVITGLGMLCAIGNSVDECWENAVAGKSGIGHTTTVDTKDCYADYAGEVKCPDLDTPENEGIDRVTKLCMRATDEAMRDAGLKGFNGDGKAAVIMGSCVGGAVSIDSYYKDGKKNKNTVLQMPISAIASQVAKRIGAGGVVTNVGNACAAGTISIAYAADLIRSGKADVVVAGGSDAFSSVPYAGFISLHALSDNPCSPFNHSVGLNLGEGSAALIVESLAHAKARGAHIYCEVLGAGITSDAHHITAPRPDGEGQMCAIYRAMASAGVTEDEIKYINAHGTGTAKNDQAEFLSLHTIFDGKNSDLNVSSTKSMTGHCLGAAGAIEAVFAVKALTENTVPPTVGYTPEDIEALKAKAGDIDFTPNTAKKKPISAVMSNSFAFGGNNASIIFGKSPRETKKPAGTKDIHITGIGAVTPLGNGVGKYVENVNSDAHVTVDTLRSAVSSADYDALGLKMAFYRKLDRFSQLQAVSGMQALSDSEYTVTDDNAFDIGIIVGTSTGAVDPACDFEVMLAERGNAAGSAFKFPNTVYNAAGGYLSICSGIKGYNVTVTNGVQSGLFGLGYAVEVIRNGDADAMLACGTDSNSDIMDELAGCVGIVSDKVVAPYKGKDKKFTLSDGSVSLLVESGEKAKARGAKLYCRVTGFASATHGTALDTVEGSGEALDRAINGALSDAGLAVTDIDGIIGFGNGHADIDKVELESYKRVFGARLSDVPVISVKERLGECRAAGAALSAAHGALMLGGEIKTEKSAYKIGKKTEKTEVKCASLKKLLVTSYGLGGGYSAVVLEKE